MDLITRSNKEQLLRSLVMQMAMQDPSRIEGFLSYAISFLDDKELDVELDLWSK